MHIGKLTMEQMQEVMNFVWEKHYNNTSRDADKHWVPRAHFPPYLVYQMKDLQATTADPNRQPYPGWRLLVAQGKGAWKLMLGREHEYEEFLHTKAG